MGFDSEDDMKDVAQDLIPSTLRKKDYEVLTEFGYGTGRTDLVFVNVSEPYWERRTKRLNLETPIEDKNVLITFLQLHARDGAVTEEYFYQIGALKRRYKRESLNWLKDRGFVQEEEEGKIKTACDLRRHITTTVAVELKLRKWQKAIKQASRGRSFAEYKFVALDHDHIEPALDNLEQFKSRNIGLLSIDQSGDCYMHHKPGRGNPHSELYRWKLNESTLIEKSA
ncbi:hypothetical protein [Halorarum halobium]|uniref:hypothetical protein n=1 Tax=Halorarum halobium TaxID=3075121 RepID=UPI0028ADB9F6|nr:hypothetical protein [Halobaculum sp. XH14]